MSGIQCLLERIGAEPTISVEEALLGAAPAGKIGLDDGLDGPNHALTGERRPDDLAYSGRLVSAPPERDLVELLPLLVDAENADVADMMMAAGINAARDLDLQ